MSFSWMKPTTFSLSKALIATLTVSIAFSSSAPSFIGNALAEPIRDDDRDSRKTRVSYAQELSEIKEDIVSKQEEIDSKKDQLKQAQEDIEDLKKYNNWEETDSIASKYSDASCECSPKNQCTVAALLNIHAITDSQHETWSIGPGGKGCTSSTTKTTIPATSPSGTPDVTYNGNKYRPGENDEGDGGGNGKGKGKNGTCKEYEELVNVNKADVCMAVYEYTKDNDRSSSYGNGLNSQCVAAARKCGKVKLAIDLERKPKDVEQLKIDIAKLEKELKKLIARRKTIDKACPDCAAIADSVDRPTLGDYIVGGLQAVSPMVIAGIQAGSYNRYLKTNLTAYNGYLANSLANCQAYISQGTTLGVPSSPCMSSMWTGGIAQAPGGGGYGIYGAIGFPGAMGGMYGYPGGYAAGYGSYGYGSFSGAIGGAIGTMIGGSFSPYGQIGGMYAPMGVGMAMGGGFSPYGQIGGMYAPMGAGMAVGGGFSPYGQIGGMYAPMGVGMAMGGGFSPYGQVGGMYAPMGAGMAIGGMAMGGMAMGGYPGAMGSYVSTMGMGGAYGYGVDPSYQLNMARMQMQGQNMQIAQQQMMEAQYRYGQVATSGAGMMSYGMAYGGMSYGYPMGYGGYGYGGGYGGGYGATAIGGVIGSVWGTAY